MAHESRQQLVQYYIEQNRLEEAGDLVVAATTDNAQNSYLKTTLAKTNKQTHVFVTHAQRTFEQAQLAGYQSLSLNFTTCLSLPIMVASRFSNFSNTHFFFINQYSKSFCIFESSHSKT